MASPARRLTVRGLAGSTRAGLGLPGHWRTIAIGLVAISPIPAFVFSMMVGSFGVAVEDVFGVIWARVAGAEAQDAMTSTVIFDIRLPRVVAAMLVGMGVSVSGAVLQGVLRNPLVDPYILGLSAGAAFGPGVG